MSENGEHHGLRGRVEAIARNELLTGINRLAIAILLPVMSFLGVQVWSDVKESQAEAKRATELVREKLDKVGSDLAAIKTDQAVTQYRLQGLERRLDRIEPSPAGAGAKTKARRHE